MAEIYRFEHDQAVRDHSPTAREDYLAAIDDEVEQASQEQAAFWQVDPDQIAQIVEYLLELPRAEKNYTKFFRSNRIVSTYERHGFDRVRLLIRLTAIDAVGWILRARRSPKFRVAQKLRRLMRKRA